MMIEAVIFDMGNVIVNLNPLETVVKAFFKYGLTLEHYQKVEKQLTECIAQFDTGLMDAAMFRTHMSAIAELKNITADEFDSCDQLRIGTIPPEHIAVLKQLKSNYKIFLLSNTDSIHLDWIRLRMGSKSSAEVFEGIFAKEYYSFQMHCRKPGAEIFNRVLTENNLKAESTVFIDDLAENIIGAEALGLQGLLWQDKKFTDLPQLLMDFKAPPPKNSLQSYL